MSTVRLCGYSTYQVELAIYKLFAKGLINKFNAQKLLNKCSRIFNNAMDQLEEVTNELNSIILGEWVEYENKHKTMAKLAFKLILFFLACMAGIGILRLFEVLSRTINL